MTCDDVYAYLLIVVFMVCGCDLYIYIEKMLEYITARDSKESGVIIIQLFEVHVFDGVYGLVLEGFVH